jgi:phenylacetic acid degradation operon negative regulatory protein
MLKMRNVPNVWSMIMTVFGDIVLPRGGVVPTALLLEILGLFSIGNGAARTALSRLVADNWLESDREGRRSSYRLTDQGKMQSLAASRRIYRGRDVQKEMDWQVAVALADMHDATGKAARHFSALSLGFCTVLPGVMVRPMPSDTAAGLPDLTGFCLMRSDMAHATAAGALLMQSQEIQALLHGYRQFLCAHAALLNLSSKHPLSASEALMARLTLVHDYRKIALKDPDFHRMHLPADWPGHQVRALLAQTYHALLAQSELWLDSAGLACPQGSAVDQDAIHRRFL